jgi:sulfoacetaldehyde dehydrogenase
MTLDYEKYISELVARSKAAQEIAAAYDQEKVDTLIAAIAYSCMRDDFRRKIAEMIVEEAGMGNVRDKMTKMMRAKSIYYETIKGKSCDLVDTDPVTGMSTYCKPMGVIGAIIPITNSESTQFSKAIMALKGRNSIILAPHPRGAKTTVVITERMRSVLKLYDAPEDLILTIDPEYVSIAASSELMKQADFVLATGGTPMVRSAYKSGTPCIGVGTGNTTTFVDGTTGMAGVADMLIRSKTFDNATSCSTENNIIVMDACYDELVAEMEKLGGYLLKEHSPESEALKKFMWPEWPANHNLNAHIVAQSAQKIAELANIKVPEGTRLLMTEENTHIGEASPLCGEKLSPVTTLYKVKSFEEALDKMEAILNYMGLGHSCGIHSNDDEKINAMATRMKVSRMCVNQPQSLTHSGSWISGFPKTCTLGCGTWGHNSVSHNVTWRDLVNFTRVSRVIPNYEPDTNELFPEEVRKTIEANY